MNARELIEKLSALDPNKEVCVYNEDMGVHEIVDTIRETTRPSDCPCCPDVPIISITSY